jgi:hypothetical protein
MSSRIARPAFAAARRATPRMTPAIRTYASPAGETSTRPPIELFGVDGTYASALVSFLFTSRAEVRDRALPPPDRPTRTGLEVY